MASKISKKERQNSSPTTKGPQKKDKRDLAPSRDPAVSRDPAPSREPAPSEDDLERMVEDATEDAYEESEQASGFLTKLEDELALPFATVVFGVEVIVERLDMTEDNRIIAVCSRGRDSQKLPLLDLPLPEPPPKGWEWIAAYRYWVR